MSAEALPDKCPVPHGSMLHLADTPYAEVAAAFDGFTVRNDAGLRVRGGNLVDRGARRRPEPDRPLTPGYHAESSFSPRQRAFIGISIATLNLTAQGRTWRQDIAPPPALAARIVSHFEGQPAGPRRFGDAMRDGILGIIDDFGRHQPNLTPAIKAMSEVAAIEGFGIAFNAARSAVRSALATDPQPKAISHFTAPGATAKNFTGSHPNTYGVPAEYEIWCSGESLAKTIIRQSHQAVSTVMSKPGSLDDYDPEKDSFFTDRYFDFDELVEYRVHAAADAAAEAHARGELA